jgi:hypothetical protein
MTDTPRSAVRVASITGLEVRLEITIPDDEEQGMAPIQNVTRSYALMALEGILAEREDGKAALVDAMFDADDANPGFATDPTWTEDNLDRYITRIRVETSVDPRRYSLHLVIADEQWLEGLEVGMESSTEAQDVFFE